MTHRNYSATAHPGKVSPAEAAAIVERDGLAAIRIEKIDARFCVLWRLRPPAGPTLILTTHELTSRRRASRAHRLATQIMARNHERSLPMLAMAGVLLGVSNDQFAAHFNAEMGRTPA